jgi:penicillin-binding protein 2
MTAQVKVPAYKIPIIMGILFLVTTGIIARLWYLQVHLNKVFFNQSQKNFLRFETIMPPRGNILDVHGNLLATNRPVHKLYWKGSGNPTFEPEHLASLTKLEAILGTPITTDQELCTTIKRAERQYKKFLIKSDLTFEQLCHLE